MKSCILALVFSALLMLPGTAQTKTDNGVIAIRNARIVTVTGETIPRGTLIIKDGKIAALSANVTIPANAKQIDATGLSVYPGMIDTYTTMGLVEVGQGAPGTVDTTELGDFNPNVKALTAVNPHSEAIAVARTNGVTTVLTCPQGGLISGQCAFINLDGWTPQEMKLTAPAAMHVVYPTVGFGGRGGGFGGGFNVGTNDAARQQRERRVEELRKKLEAAQEYQRAREASARDKSLPAHPTDLGLEALLPVLKGEVPVLVNASGKREIEGALELADKFKLKLIIHGGEDAYQVADKLKAKNVPVVLGAVLDLPDKEDDPYDMPYARAAVLHKAGVKFCITTTDTATDVRLLPFHAGTAAAFGLPKEEALKAVTIYPAQIFGIDKLVGSLEVGKIANLIVTDGDPLELRTRVKHVFINGKPVDLSSKHTRLNDKFKDRQ
ncbi:MAG: amidohydrolase family protein [Acidobacteria bacterium]|nr:amidohydrolase family protein [Acidobacteriota bacterium]MBI3424195.1 amidohydrolase family protein [Acidobacteriota bacterium]